MRKTDDCPTVWRNVDVVASENPEYHQHHLIHKSPKKSLYGRKKRKNCKLYLLREERHLKPGTKYVHVSSKIHTYFFKPTFKYTQIYFNREIFKTWSFIESIMYSTEWGNLEQLPFPWLDNYSSYNSLRTYYPTITKLSDSYLSFNLSFTQPYEVYTSFPFYIYKNQGPDGLRILSKTTQLAKVHS